MPAQQPPPLDGPSKMSHLVIMAAGTGGHIIPGLAVAREMQSRGWTISWLGTAAGMENRLVPPSGIPLDTVGFSGLRGKGLAQSLRGGVKLLRAFGECLRILRRRGADAVLGMGGYVCVPGGVVRLGFTGLASMFVQNPSFIRRLSRSRRPDAPTGRRSAGRSR